MKGSELFRECVCIHDQNNNLGGELHEFRANILSKLTYLLLLVLVVLVLTRYVLGWYNAGVMHSFKSEFFLHPLSMVQFVIYTSGAYK